MKVILFTIITNSFCQKKLRKVVQLAHFAILFKCRCLLISSKAQQASCFPTLKNLKTNYQNTSIQLSQSCLVGSKWKSKNCKKSRFFWFLNLHNLLERACDHIKRCICLPTYLSTYLYVHLDMSRNLLQNTLKLF